MFDAGTRVRTRIQVSSGHTRLPSYLQCRSGVVVRALGEFPLPDERARDPEHPRLSELYTVQFDARDVWERPDEGTICADLFEEYLESAP